MGRLHFGARPRPAVQLIYGPDVKTADIIYLVFDNLTALKQVWADLIVDAPPGMIPANQPSYLQNSSAREQVL